jgi:hypothetical protein
MMVAIYEDLFSKGTGRIEALKQARDITNRYVMAAIRNVPGTSHFFEAFARSLIWADSREGSRYATVMNTVFRKRHLIPANATGLSALSLPRNVNVQNGVHLVRNMRTIKISEVAEVSALAFNPLYDVEVTVPQDEAYYVDENGMISDYHAVDEEETISKVRYMLDYLHNRNLVNDTENSPFEISNGKLVRSNFACCTVGCRVINKNDPEYLKPPKPQNNAGCGCSCRQKTTVPAKKTVKIGCFIRYKTA